MIKLTDMMARHVAEKQPLKVADLQAGLQMAINSFGFIGHGIALLNMKRREAIKPEINHELKKICSAQVPVTNLLFGDDLCSRVKGIQYTNTLGHRVQAITTSQNSINAFSKPS